mgnify:CR=1 FL=1
MGNTARISRGFTLIEVLIAMAITALVAVLSYQSLSSVLNSVESLRDNGERVSELNRTWTVVSRDIRQFVPRPVRDEFGESESAMWGGSGADSALSLTRGGWYNPNQQLRSSLQRVRYRLEDDELWRESYTVLDRVGDSEPQRALLLEGVVSFELAFLSPQVTLRGAELDTDDWPDNWGLNASNSRLVDPPQALELRLELEDLDEVRWLYELPGQ